MVIKALKEPERDRKKVKHVKHNGNISLADVIDIARKCRDRSVARELKGTVKEVLGTAVSVGCTVDDTPAQEMQRMVDEGEVVIPAK